MLKFILGYYVSSGPLLMEDPPSDLSEFVVPYGRRDFRERRTMKTIGNVLWLVVCGVWLALGWMLWALICAITVVGLPFARQCVKLANFSLWPFGRTVVKDPTASKLGGLGAILWIIPGVFMAISYVVSGALLCLTVIGIPFGIQSIKLAGLALQPFGKKVIRTKDLAVFYAGAPAS